jgi:hypothetical protein
MRSTQATAEAKRTFATWSVAGTGWSKPDRRAEMATQKQVQAAKRNIGKAQQGARSKRTLANLPAETRRDMGRQAAKARSRGGQAGHGYEDRTREQLYEVAKQRGIAGRSKMGKWQLIDALRRS